MKTLLIIQLCTVFDPATNLKPFCHPTQIPFPTVQLCEERAEYYNTKFEIKRVYKGDKASNEMALLSPAKCIAEAK